MAALTVKQNKVLGFLRDYIAEQGRPPTRAEISRALGFSSANAAQEHLKNLARKGVLELQPGSSRGIRLLKDAPQQKAESLIELPLVGQVAAGAPVLAIEHIEAYHCVSASLFSPRPDYLLRVRGMSMLEAGILDGDLLAVRAGREAQSGQIVVARLDDEVTVKRFVRRGRRIILEAMNPDFEPIELEPARQEITIEGVAAGVIRCGG